VEGRGGPRRTTEVCEGLQGLLRLRGATKDSEGLPGVTEIARSQCGVMSKNCNSLYSNLDLLSTKSEGRDLFWSVKAESIISRGKNRSKLIQIERFQIFDST
jgi:hypothetical protein